MGCCCGGISVDCGGCTSMPESYSVSPSGITNGTCSDCTEWNTTFTITNIGGDLCIWRGFYNAGCCSTGDEWYAELSFLGDSLWHLKFYCRFGASATEVADYTLDSASWSCLGANTLSRASNSGHCATWPATLTLTPV